MVVVVAVGWLGSAAAAPDPATRAAQKCRAVIGAKAAGLVKTALKQLDGCHARRDKGRAAGDCNGVDLTSLRGRLTSAIGKACVGANRAKSNYPGGDPAGTIVSTVAIELAASGRALQGTPALVADKTKRRCHAAIGKARSGIVTAIVGGAVRCQRAVDRSDFSFGGLAANCVLDGGSAAGRARAGLARSCAGLAGPDVGSCTALPDCVVEAAAETGQAVARALYGAATSCGDGVVQNREQCDDGNTDPTDACTAECRSAVCGDGVVQAGVEECDDENIFDDDACIDCRAARCGDGVLHASAEQCDDGNTTPNDGCTDCHIDPLTCNPGRGLAVTVSVAYDAVSFPEVQGVELNLGYPAPVAIPGSGEEQAVRDRVTDLGSAAILTPNDSDTNGDGTDDRLRVVYAGNGNIPVGDLVRARFDCQTAAVLDASAFRCVVTSASDPLGLAVTGATCAVALATP